MDQVAWEVWEHWQALSLSLLAAECTAAGEVGFELLCDAEASVRGVVGCVRALRAAAAEAHQQCCADHPALPRSSCKTPDTRM